MMSKQRDWIMRMLSVLEYPFEFEASDPASLAKLVSWIEDRKVRLWEIEARAPLRTAGYEWDSAFARYLNELECPVAWPKDAVDCVGYLLSHAVECEYEDDEARILQDADRACKALEDADQRADEVWALCDALGLEKAQFNDVDEALLAILGATARLRDAAEPAVEPLSEDCYPLGLTTGETRTDEIARVLRLLYLLDLRHLQDSVNDILIKAQNFIADPKTNSALGKVGR